MTIKYGITGNYYVTSLDKSELVVVCNAIDKSETSIKWHDKYKCWVFRVKDKTTKVKLKKYFGLIN
jgi:hypothetical protein